MNIETYIHTWLREGEEANGQTGHFQSWTVSEANVTAKVAWIVETRRLQNSNDRFGKAFLIKIKAVDHERTANTTKLVFSSIFLLLFFNEEKGNPSVSEI